MLKLNIKSVFKNYEIIFVSDLKKQLKELNKKYSTHYLIDENIWKIYKKDLDDAKNALSSRLFDAREINKTLYQVHKYVEYLLDKKIQKKHKIVVIGGGLVQDIGSFTAHIIKRGIDWIFIPTTLLAMADSCIGGKSGINVSKYKNQVGSFHPPTEIYIYSKIIKTLPDKELINGVGEIIKHGLIKGGIVYKEIKKNLSNIQNNIKTAEKIIYQSLLIKKEIVEKDELDLGLRKLLNYGHTFGHALEGYTKNTIPHGLGVLFGMDMANYISFKRHCLSKTEYDDLHHFLRNYIPVDRVGITNIDQYLDFLSKDKKVVGEEVQAILCQGVGRIQIIKIKIDEKLKNEIVHYVKEF